jgi:integrase
MAIPGDTVRNTGPKKLRLTDRSIQAIRPPRAGDQAIVYDSHEPGMALRTMASGHKSFVFVGRFPPSTNPTRRSLGSYAGPLRAEPVPPEDELLALEVLTLGQAREKARLWRRLIQRGIDPDIEAKRRHSEKEEQERKAKADTFEAVARRFLAEHMAQARTAKAVGQLIENKLIAAWGSRPITTITKRDVLSLIADIKAKAARGKGARGGDEAARQALAYTKLLFSWALEADIVSASPCPTLGKRSKLLRRKKSRQRVLGDDEIKLLWRATEANLYPADSFTRLLLILGCRRGELAAARWREFRHLDKPGAETWELKGTRTKSGDPRVVPLPAMAVQIITELPRFAGGDFLFAASGGRRPFCAFSRLKTQLDNKITKLNGGPIEQFGLHDLRRSMRTRLSALQIAPTKGSPPAPIPPLVAELMIGHKQQGIAPVYDTYRYIDEQRAGFEAWCAKLRDIIEPPPPNVVRFDAAEARA